jgi:WD40 repeat protein
MALRRYGLWQYHPSNVWHQGTEVEDACLWLWCVETGAVVQTFAGVSDWFSAAVLALNGRFVLSWHSADHRVRLWDTRSGRCLRCLGDLEGKVLHADISPDASLLLTVCGGIYGTENHLWLWNSETGG